MQLELFSLLGARGEAAPLLAAGTTPKQGIPILNPDPLARLIGRQNEADICVNGLNVRALLDTGTQVTSVSDALCTRLGLRIYKLKGIAMEGTGGICIEYVGYTKIHVALPECPKRPDSNSMFSVPAIVLKELEYQKEVFCLKYRWKRSKAWMRPGGCAMRPRLSLTSCMRGRPTLSMI